MVSTAPVFYNPWLIFRTQPAMNGARCTLHGTAIIAVSTGPLGIEPENQAGKRGAPRRGARSRTVDNRFGFVHGHRALRSQATLVGAEGWGVLRPARDMGTESQPEVTTMDTLAAFVAAWNAFTSKS